MVKKEKSENNFKKKTLVLLLSLVTFTFLSLMILNPGENFSEVINIQEFTQTILGLVIVNSQPSEDVIDYSNVTAQPEFSHLNISNISYAYDVTDAYQGRPIVSYWSFDVDTGTTVYDYGDYNNDGTINSSPSFVTGLYENAYDFDGLDDYIQQDIKMVDSFPFTMSAWIKKDSHALDWIFAFTDKDGNTVFYDIQTTAAGTAAINVRDGGSAVTAVGTTNVSDGNWHNIVGVFASDTDKRLYVDGVNEANITSSEVFNANVDRWCMGVRCTVGYSAYFDGTIDDVAVYGIALNESEVLQLFNNQSVRFVPNGIQTFRAFNVTLDENRVNISQTFSNFSSYISSRIAQINMSVSSNHGLLLYNPIEFNSAWDYSSNENDVTTTIGTPTFNATSGVNGTGGVEFVPEEGYKIAWNDKLNATDELTISAWVKPTFIHVGPNDAVIVETNNLQNNDGYSLAFAEAQEDFQFRVTTDVATKNVHTDAGWAANEWIHLVATYNGSNIYIYYNGVLNGTNTQSGKIITNTASNLSIGIRSINDNLGWDGTLDEISVWNRSLTAAEVNALYNDTAKSFNKIFYSDYQNGSSEENMTFITSSEFVFAELYYSSGDFGFYSPTLEQNLTVGSFFTPGDSCTVPGSGNWEITCSDNCTLSTEANLEGNLSLIGGNGTFDITGNLTFTNAGSYIFLDTPACQINIHSGGMIG